jgi:hypothetical protein
MAFHSARTTPTIDGGAICWVFDAHDRAFALFKGPLGVDRL